MAGVHVAGAMPGVWGINGRPPVGSVQGQSPGRWSGEGVLHPPEAEAKCKISVQFFNVSCIKILDLMNLTADVGEYILQTQNTKQFWWWRGWTLPLSFPLLCTPMTLPIEPLGTNYRLAQKSKPLPTDQKIVLNRIKTCEWIRFICLLKVWIKQYNIMLWN